MPIPQPSLLARAPLLVAAALTALAAAPVHAQEGAPDTRAPVIEIETLTEVAAADSQVFSAQVADDGELDSVTLHHRREGEGPFVRSPMRALGTTGYYGVSIPTDPADLAAIEYYVQAIDGGGNRTVNGFAFDPLRRTLTAAAVPLASGTPNGGPDGGSSVPTDGGAPSVSSGRTRWWAVALGVVAVGALASFANSGDDGGGDGNVPLTVDVPRPGAR